MPGLRPSQGRITRRTVNGAMAAGASRSGPRRAATRCIPQMVCDPVVHRVSHEVLKYYRQGGALYVSAQVRVLAVVRNLFGDKIEITGIRYTTDNWATWKDNTGQWSRHCDGDDTDEFVIHTESTLPPGGLIYYAIYCTAGGVTHWANNNGANYSAQL